MELTDYEVFINLNELEGSQDFSVLNVTVNRYTCFSMVAVESEGEAYAVWKMEVSN